LQALLLAAHEADKKLKRLLVKEISHAFFDLPPELTPKIYDALSDVGDLRIGLCGAVFQDGNLTAQPGELLEMLEDLDDRKMVPFLASAGQLRRLILQPPRPENYAPRVPLNNMVGDTTWPHLQSLSLGVMNCTASELLHLLFRHGSTLKRLELADLTFSNLDWESDDSSSSLLGGSRLLRACGYVARSCVRLMVLPYSSTRWISCGPRLSLDIWRCIWWRAGVSVRLTIGGMMVVRRVVMTRKRA